MIVALIYTEGVIFGEKDGSQEEEYCLLELAYCDIEGNHFLFYVQSPISKNQAVHRFNWHTIRETLGAVMCPYSSWKGHPLSTIDEVVEFLKDSHHHFRKSIPDAKIGYLGSSRHRDILDLARVPSINLKDLGCPHVSTLAVPISTSQCRFHPYGRTCARDKLHAMVAWFNLNLISSV